jgi:ribosomal-protein-alanine N-acetyltransferase
MSELRKRAEPLLLTGRLRIELAGPEHAELHAAYFENNREHFAPWDPPRPVDADPVAAWRRRIETSRAEFAAGRAAQLVALPAEGAAFLIARISFSQIVRGPFQSCMLGYSIDRGHEGRGLMTEALRAALDWVFDELKLHRVQANHRPENERSARVLQRLGFVREGVARQYLFIDGAWRDHVLNALINPRFDSAALLRDLTNAPNP